MIRPIKRRVHGLDRWVYIARCHYCHSKVGGDYVDAQHAQTAMDAHECEATS